MNESTLANILEALLMSSGRPLREIDLEEAFESREKPQRAELTQALRTLEQRYQDGALELKRVASGWQFQTREEYSRWILKLEVEKPAKLTQAFLETLAIIAYKQPVTRADIEEIRGVSVSSQIMKTLIEREWIKVAGHRDVAGKPAVYMTTKTFLDYFNLENICQLPDLALTSQKSEIQSETTEFEQLI